MATQADRGCIYLILGPMFSGKTSELLNRISVRRIACSINGEQCTLIRNAHDKRYDNAAIVTHSGLKDFNNISTTDLASIKDEVKDCKYIFIDEGQFFKNLADHCIEWFKQGKEVHIAALNGDSNQQPWEEISKIIPWVDQIHKLNAICRVCSKYAPLTIRLDKSDTQKVRVGGSECYRASCIYCKDTQV